MFPVSSAIPNITYIPNNRHSFTYLPISYLNLDSFIMFVLVSFCCYTTNLMAYNDTNLLPLNSAGQKYSVGLTALK